MSASVRNILIGAAAMLLLLILIGLLIVLTGGYNVAATDRHNPIIGWALTTTMRNHVQNEADNLTAPTQITPAMVAAGAGEYKKMCAHCHGGVGTSRAEWAKTIRPIPPALAHAAKQWSIEEVHWIVSHGIKMSGMPAFGPTHDEESIWNIAAFVRQMPEMSAEQYAAFGAEPGTADEGHTHSGQSTGSGH